MVRWMHGILTEKVKPCSMHMQIFHFIIRGMLTYGREREYFLSFQNQKFSKQQSWTQNQRQATLSKFISLFWKQSKGEESLFLKEKQEAHYMHMHSIFRFFLQHR